MSLGSRSQDSAIFLRIKEGNVYLASDKEFATPYNSISGHITDIYQRAEEFNGAQTVKTYFRIESPDNGDKFLFNFAEGSQNWFTVLNFLSSANIHDTVQIDVSPSKDLYNGKPNTNIFVKQDGTSLKFKFSKASGNPLPEWKKFVINGKPVYDKTESVEIFKGEINRMLKELGKGEYGPKTGGTQQTSNPVSQPQQQATRQPQSFAPQQAVSNNPTTDDDLPF